MTDFETHLTRQAAVSRALFGPGPRTAGVSDHICKELDEIDKAETERERGEEWVDVAILGLDGLLRSIWVEYPTFSADMVAAEAVAMILKKQGKNERRDWPNWRSAPTDKAIEHKRGFED